ncbi:DUF6476 family protein [Oceaniovalibus sp. ACAM 378]|uniref:DUF6476 family protein n=1 Tax=Oceaniovalibus sp. ACAM 378 TaxID=2599923 RepID=UPI0011D910B4|nr:DUF6476 family protein [Oceaniovalibus sp. ACAM 378]TYB88020.1 hypothetical protein FQ320_12755 [Oceaniovalibus sp. ACAM 378]
MNNTPDKLTPDQERLITFLRRLVTTLTVVMIAGLIIVIGLLVTRFPKAVPVMPDHIALPDGTSASAFTRGQNWVAVVTTDDKILIFDPTGTTLRQTIDIAPR